jgi:hypothetical protein
MSEIALRESPVGDEIVAKGRRTQAALTPSMAYQGRRRWV